MNLGNTCYFNAAIQCLTHIEPLSAYFMKDLFLHEINKESEISFSFFRFELSIIEKKIA